MKIKSQNYDSVFWLKKEIKMRTSGIKMNVINCRNEKLDYKLHIADVNVENGKNDVTCREILNEYLNNSSLHGLRYVGDRKLSRCERLIYMFLYSSMKKCCYFTKISND